MNTRTLELFIDSIRLLDVGSEKQSAAETGVATAILKCALGAQSVNPMLLDTTSTVFASVLGLYFNRQRIDAAVNALNVAHEANRTAASYREAMINDSYKPTCNTAVIEHYDMYRDAYLITYSIIEDGIGVGR